MKNMIEFITKKIINRYHPKIIGVISADGLSGIKESLFSILQKKYTVRASRAIKKTETAYEEIIGIGKSDFSSALLFKIMPLLLLNKNFPEIIVLEFSVSDKENIKKIGKLGINFDFLIIDSTGENGGRLADLRNLIKIFGEKTKIIINKDNKNLTKLSGELKFFSSYSAEKSSADIYALALSQGTNKWLMLNGKIGLSFKACVKSNTVPVRMEKVAGKEYVSAAIAGYSAGLALGMNLVEISEALQNYRGINGKMNVTPGIKNTLIINQTKYVSCDYIKEAISVFKKVENRRKVAVIGDILNLGKNTEMFHRKIGRALALAGTEILIAVGERAVFVKDEAIKAGIKENNIYVFSENEIKKTGIFIQDLMKEKDVLLVTGSEELNMEKIIKEIKA